MTINKGYFVIQRGVFDSPIFKDEPYTEKLAWLWLMEHASYEPHKLRYQNQIITLGRGQVPTSYRKLAKVWGWGVNRVSGFISVLEREGWITKKTDTGFLIITICNYDVNKNDQEKTDTLPDTLPDTVSDTVSDTNINKGIKGNKGKEISLVLKNKKIELPDWLPQEKWDEFVEHRKSLKSKMTRNAEQLNLARLAEFKNQGHDPIKIINETIMRGWKGFFAPDSPKTTSPQKQNFSVGYISPQAETTKVQAGILTREEIGICLEKGFPSEVYAELKQKRIPDEVHNFMSHLAIEALENWRVQNG